MILRQGAADIRTILEAEESILFHLHKTLEQLLIAVEKVVVNLNIEATLNLLQVFHGIYIRKEVLFSQLVLFLLLFVPRIHNSQANHRVHLARHIV